MGGDSARTHSAFMYGYVACARDPEQNAMGNHPLLWSLHPEGNTVQDAAASSAWRPATSQGRVVWVHFKHETFFLPKKAVMKFLLVCTMLDGLVSQRYECAGSAR